jgi:pimeloyl-ACP methyl ester carboxylesterase
LTEADARRLVVFVHGFRGRAVQTWNHFAESGEVDDWWRESDLLFVGYDSVRENITGVASRIRRRLPELFPRLPSELLELDGVRVRASASIYDELVLVGHSLGGVIVRRALADSAQDWLERSPAESGRPKPILLEARVCLFSPASAGFRAAGRLGLAKASPGWVGVEMLLRRSSAFSDLQPGSSFLVDTRRRTEQLVVQSPELCRSLRAALLWANPDDVVLTERYDSDFVDDSVDGTTHSSVCKPHDGFTTPWTFVETGQV